MTLREKLQAYKSAFENMDDVEACRFFVGQDVELTIPQLRNHGNALVELLDCFFLKWASKWGQRAR